MAGFCALAVTGHASADHPLTSITRWAIVLDDGAPVEASSLQLVVMDPDHHAPWSAYPSDCLRLAALSVGEAEDRRSYWSGISSASYLVEQDKDSEGASVRVDFRDPRWQKLLLEQEIPRVLAAGFQGFLLDTLDSVTYLEDKDPEKFAGSRKALAVWLADLRQAYPNVILLARGSEALEVAAPYVDGYVADGLFTTWDRLSRRARKTTPEERDAQLDQVGNAMVLAARPLFTIEYADSRQKALGRWATEESSKRRFRPFIEIR